MGMGKFVHLEGISSLSPGGEFAAAELDYLLVLNRAGKTISDVWKKWCFLLGWKLAR